MKPKSQGPHDEGFLEYLEDIIGSNQYVERIDEANKQLEVLNEKRGSMVQRVKIAEKEKDGLEESKNEAEGYMLKEAELLKWKGKAAELYAADAKSNALKVKENVTELEAALQSERETFAQHLKAMKELEGRYNKQSKRKEELEDNLKNCSEEFKEFERQDLKYREDLKHMKQKLKKLDEKAEKDAVKIQELEKESEDSANAIAGLEEEVIRLTERLPEEEKTLDKIRESSKGEIENLREQLSVVRAELDPWEKQIIECQGKLDLASSEKKLLTEKHEAGQKAYEKAQEQIKSIKLKVVEKEKELQSIRTAIDKNQSLVKGGRDNEQLLAKEEESISSQEQSARQKLAELQSLLNSEKSQGSVLKALMQAKESGELPGIFGRLGDLGAIAAKYDVAISTACPGLDYIVVDTANTAQACVEMLRTRNLGVATFLILDKQEGHRQKMKEKVQTPEGVPRLYDLVKTEDDRLRLAFFAVLGNLVVAKDLDQATRIAYGPDREFRRVVTLDGAVFEKSGTMSGGGGKPKGGRMGTAVRTCSVSAETIAKAEEDLRALIDQRKNVREKLNASVQQYKTAEKAVSQLELQLAKVQMEVEGLKAQQKDIEQQLESLKASANPPKDELQKVKELEKTIVSAGSDLNKLNKSSKSLRDKADELQKKMENAGGDKLQKQKALVEKLQKDIDSMNTEINRRKVKITTGSKTISKLKKGLEDAAKEKASFTEEKEKRTNDFKDVEKKALIVQEKFTNLKEILGKQQEELDSAQKEYNDLKKVVDDLRTKEVDAQYKLDDLKKVLKDWEMKSKGYQKQMEDLCKNLKHHVEQIQKEGIEAGLLQSALAAEQLDEGNELSSVNERIALIEAQLKELKPNLDAIAEYRQKAVVYDERVNELNEVTQERDDLKKAYDDLRKKRLDEFMAGFNAISLKLKEMYQMITLGGDAELELVDSLDPFSEGVVFSVRPPKKSWKNIGNLSGGEKTLSSLALVFALHHYKPTPLYVMDEIDAALDFKNVSIVGHYIKDRTKDAQFIIISLRNNMFELADRLIGIYKTDNCTKSITINPSSFAVSAAS
ncbi:hypothetical protein KP509_07G037500 [Ceratopteris richardii]|nr:hypothetical protein KP509_07G037500 [Ceratopteris richardii]